MLDDLTEARAHYLQALEASRGLAESFAATILLNLGLVAFSQRDVHAARAYFERSLAHYAAVGEPGSVAACLDGLGGVLGVAGDARCAAQLLGAADALRAAINEPIQPTDRADHDRFVTAARSRLDEAAFEAGWAEGARMTQ